MRKLFYLMLAVCTFYGASARAQVAFPRALTSYGDSAGHPNLVYEDDNAQHIHLLSYNGSSWSDQDLSNMTGNQDRPMSNSPLTSLAASDGTHRIFYVCSTLCAAPTVDAVCQLLESGSTWSVSCGNALGEGAEALVEEPNGANTQLTSYDNGSCGGGQHVVYQDNTSDTHMLYYHGGAWTDANLTQLYGGSPEPGTPLGSYVRTDTCGDHVDDFDQTSGPAIAQYWQYSGWHFQWLGGKGILFPNVANLSAYADCHGEHIVFVNALNGHLIQWYYNFSSWSEQDLGVAADGQRGIKSFGDSSCVEHNFYLAPTSDVHQIYYNGSWHDQDLTAITRGAPAGNSDLTGFASGSNQYVFYLDSNGLLDQLHYNGSNWSWVGIEFPQ